MVNSQYAVAGVEGVGKTIGADRECIFEVARDEVVGVGERYIVEISADYGCVGRIFQEICHLSGLHGSFTVVLYKSVHDAAQLALSLAVEDIFVLFARPSIFS